MHVTPGHKVRSNARRSAAALLAWCGIALGAAEAGAFPDGSPGEAQAAPAGAAAPIAGAAALADHPFPPEEADLPLDRFALYIGISDYPRIPNQSLDGTVNDVLAMRALMAERFGFHRAAIVTDARATRAGIAAALGALVDQVAAARRRHEGAITALICYAGHGSQVQDQPEGTAGHDEPDGRDETWVPFDSSFKGENDIRDDEIASVWSALAAQGAQVVLFSDSCHSGTVHRGHSVFKSRSIDRASPGAGAMDDLFARFVAGSRMPAGRGPGAGSLVDGEPLPGFVAYTAAKDSQRAFEYADEAGASCGRFTFALRRVLGSIGPQATYQEVHQKLAMQFDQTWPDRLQSPQFDASAAKRLERFLEGGFAPLHATVVARSQAGTMLELTMGGVHGVTMDSTFEFFSDLDDLAERRRPMARAMVEAVEPLKCRVRLESEVKIPDSAKARLDVVRVSEFPVCIDGGVPAEVSARLREMASKGQIQVVDQPAASAVVVMPDPVEPAISLYAPTAMPVRGSDPALQPAPLRRIYCESAPQAVDLVAENVRYLARSRRLMALDHGAGQFHAEVVIIGREGPGERSDEGIPRMREGEQFRLRFRNMAAVPMYLTIIAPDAQDHLAVLYPRFDDPVRPIAPQGQFELPLFDATIFDRAVAARDGFERSQLKVIATSERMDFEPLTAPPETGAPAARTRGGSEPGRALLDLMQDAIDAGPRTRGLARRVVTLEWATGTIVFDVEPAP